MSSRGVYNADEDITWCSGNLTSSSSVTRKAFMWLPFRNPGCHTQAQSLDEVAKRIREAIELCLEVEGTPKQDLEFRRNPAHYDRGMSRAPRVTGTDIIVALSKIGFQVVRVRGSHHFLSPRGWAKRPLCLCGAWPIIGRRAN